MTGGNGNDKLTGNGLQNVLTGAQGDDTIDGGSNNGTLTAVGATRSSKDGVRLLDCGIDNDRPTPTRRSTS